MSEGLNKRYRTFSRKLALPLDPVGDQPHTPEVTPPKSLISPKLEVSRIDTELT